jgi:hypothetical protein
VPTWRKIHGERLVDDTRRLHLSIASVELPDGVKLEQYVSRAHDVAAPLHHRPLGVGIARWLH